MGPMHLLVTRPEPDAQELANRLAECGHQALIEPLLYIEFPYHQPLPSEGIQALIATSRNGLRALAHNCSCEMLLNLPIFVVGEGVAEIARELGFEIVHIGAGTARDLVSVICAQCRPNLGTLLHLSGKVQAWDLKGALEEEGFEILAPAVYSAKAAQKLNERTVEVIRNGAIDGVILMSPRTAQIFLKLISLHGLEEQAKSLVFFCISKAVANNISGFDAKRVRIAVNPSLEDVLILIADEAAHSQ